MQLATGFGKSFLLGLLAQHLNIQTGKKVLVVVPTPFLQLYQESNYCPTASKVPEEIADPNCPNIFYCCYDQFMTASFTVPTDTILLVDEFHELFFNKLVGVINGRLVSVVQKLTSAQKVIGVSATFHEEAGIKKIHNILADSLFIIPPIEIKQKKLQLEVIGSLSSETIFEKAVLLA